MSNDSTRAADALRRSEERLDLARAAGIGFFELDLLANTSHDDARVRELWGLDPETPLTPELFWAGIHPDDRDRAKRAFDAALDSARGGLYADEYRVIGRRDGATRWIVAAGRTEFREQRPVRWLTALIDVTPTKAAETALQDAEERRRLALLWTRAAAWEWDMRANEARWSPEYFPLMGVDPNTMVPSYENFLSLIHPDDRARAVAEFEAAAARGGCFEIEFRIIRPIDGAVIWVASSGRVEHDAAGKPIFARGINRDTTALREAWHALQEKEALARDALERSRAREAELRLVTDHAPVCLAHCDADERFVFVNRAWAEWFGRTPEDMIGKRFAEVLGPTGHACLSAHVQDVIRGEPVDFEKTLPRGETLRRVHSIYVPEPGPPGSRRGFVAVLEDVTERHATEEALRQRERELRSLADSSPDIIARFDRNCRVVFVNETVRRVTGRDPATLLGKVPGEDLQAAEHLAVVARLRAAIRHVFETGRSETFELRVTPPGGWRHYSVCLVPEYGPDGTLEHVLGVGRDVTEAKRAEIALRTSEQRLRAATEAAGIGIGAWYPDEDRISMENDRAYEIFGLSRNDPPPNFQGFLSEFILPEDVPELQRVVTRTIEGGPPVRAMCRARRKDGQVRWVEFTGTLHRTRSGGRSVVGTVADVTERQELMEQARQAAQANAKFRTIFEQGSQFAGILSLDGTVMEANRLSVEGGGFKREDAIGRRFWECGWWNRSETLMQRIREATLEAAAGKVCRLEVPYFIANGTERCMELTLLPVTDDTGKVLFIVPTGTDITVRKRAERELRDADRRKDEFLATLAHELRNPLAPIRTGLELIKRSPPGSLVAVRARATMERQIAHMVRLIDDLLDLSRIARGKLELRKQRVELRSVIESALETSYPAIAESHHELSVRVPDDTVWLDGDVTRLAQVVGNILSNAAKYTPERGRIVLHAFTEGDSACIRVSDTGVGIPREMLANVFDMFTQVNKDARTRTQGGLGIGLALVRLLVEMHGGSVDAQSAGPGQGSTFTVRLPLAGVERRPERPAPGQPGALHTAPATRRVLIVDDNVDGAEMLASMLELSGHETKTAHDGPTALSQAHDFRPDLVLLDIGLPGMDGYEVAERFKKDPALQDAVLVAITGWGSEEDKRRTHAAGFDFHLTKPVEINAIEDVLAKADAVRPIAQKRAPRVSPTR